MNQGSTLLTVLRPMTNTPPVLKAGILGAILVWPFLLVPSSAKANEKIDLSQPVSKSVPAITGVYWSFDELDGDSVDDGSANDYRGTLDAGNGKQPRQIPGVTGEGGVFGSAIRLETAATEPGELGNPRIYVNLPQENRLGMTASSFTGGLWVRFDSTKAEGSQRVVLLDRGGFTMRLGVEGAGHYSLFLDRDAKGIWQVGFAAGNGSENEFALTETPDLGDGKWHHLGFNYLYREAGDYAVVLWLNGELLDEVAMKVEISSGHADIAVHRFFVGDRTVPSFLSLFDGAVDDVFVTEGVYDFVPPRK